MPFPSIHDPNVLSNNIVANWGVSVINIAWKGTIQLRNAILCSSLKYQLFSKLSYMTNAFHFFLGGLLNCESKSSNFQKYFVDFKLIGDLLTVILYLIMEHAEFNWFIRY